MRRILYFVCCICLNVFLIGCGQSKNQMVVRQTTENAVDQIVKEQTKRTENNATSEQIEDIGTTEGDERYISEYEKNDNNTTIQEEVIDYDLTSMSSDMVYSTVYQIMVNPNEYIGKIIRMKGQYYVSKDETTGLCYHCCLIKDATACCANGMEFIWGDGTHLYPDDYPKDGTDIVVQGSFETYTENDAVYCRLVNATLEIE